MKKLAVPILLLLVFSCNKEKLLDGPDFYQDDFEAYDTIEQLIDGENVLWSFFQISYDTNTVKVDSSIVHTGQRSIRCSATATTEVRASKASINKQFMAFWENETVVMDGWYYIEGIQEADWLFLFDLEEKVAIGAGPGMRLALVEDQLLVEHKYPNPDIRQDTSSIVYFPRNQWVHIVFETRLSTKKSGYVKVWQDDQLIIEQYEWKTLPTDILYFQQGTAGMYNQIEFGVTANSWDHPMVVYVDDLSVYTR